MKPFLEGEHRSLPNLDDRALAGLMAVMTVIAAAARFAMMIIYTWDYIIHEPDNMLVLEMVLGNTYKDIVWMAVGALMWVKRGSLPLNRSVSVLAWLFAFYIINPYGVPVGTNAVEYLIEVTSALLAFGLIVFGIMLWLGNMKYARAMGFIAMFYVAYEVLTYRTTLLDSISSVMGFEEFLYYVLPYIPYTVLMLLFTYVLFSPGIMPRSLINQLSDAADRAIDTGFSDADSYMVRTDVISMNEMLSGPREDGDGAISCEMRFPLIGAMRGRVLTVRRWKGEDFLRATVGSSSGSFDGYRFQVRQIVPDTGSLEDCGIIRIYGEPGMYADIMVRDREMTFQELSALELEQESLDLRG